MARILYLCPGVNQTPHGGKRRLYRHVDVLNGAGFEAYVIHARPGHRLEWFPNQTRILSAPVRLNPDDILVIPEVYREKTYTIAPGIRRVSLNLRFFNWLPSTSDSHLVDATVTNSEYARSLLARLIPAGPVHLVPHAIDRRVWYAEPGRKRRLVSYMPRRDPALAEATVNLLRESSVLRGWEFRGIHNASESEVATQLRSSELFLSFARREGFGRPPVEALACGSSVIGFSGVGGTEVFESTSASEVRDGDILALVGAVEDWAENFDRYPGQVREQQLSDAHSIQNAYTPEGERQALVDVFGELSELPPKSFSTAAMELTQDDVHPVVNPKMRLRRAAHEFKQAWRSR